jgi:hypothetical protein
MLYLINDSSPRLSAASYLFQALDASIAIPLKTTFFYNLAAASFVFTAVFSLFHPSFRLLAENA